jgi:hypothetical protein
MTNPIGCQFSRNGLYKCYLSVCFKTCKLEFFFPQGIIVHKFFGGSIMKLLKSFGMALCLTAVFFTTASFAQSVGAERAQERIDTEKKGEILAQPKSALDKTSLEPEVATSNNYAFGVTTNGTFTNMSGSTQLVAAGADDTSSAVTTLPFEFYFMGVKYTQFSANSNGFVRLGGTAVSTTQYILGTAAVPLITAMGSDNIVSTSGKVHYKITGSAPNRVLTVEFLNITTIYDGIGTAPDTTTQVRLYETTGVIELVYGAMNRGAGTGFASANNAQYMGFSSTNTAGNMASVNTADVSVTTSPPTANQFPLSTLMASLNSPVEGARKVYTYTPPVPVAPTNNGVSGVTTSTLTLNWNDTSSNETQFAVFRSTDNVNFLQIATVAENGTSFADSGLLSNTPYFYRVFAISEGAFSSALTFSPSTAAGGAVSCNGAGGNWNTPGTWSPAGVPLATDAVTITNGCIVTIDTAAVGLNVTIQNGGTLQFDSGAAQSLTLTEFVTINLGGTFQTQNTGAITGHNLSVGTSITNNGTLDFSTSGNTAGANITFTSSNAGTFGGSGATTDIRTITMNKGASNANILELNPTNFTVQGVNTDVAGFLTSTNGTFKISGTFTMTNRVFATAAYAIPATGGIWLNNPNFTVAGQGASPTVSGVFRMTLGTYNIGTGTGNSMGFNTGSLITVEGGAINATGRFGVAAATNAITYNQTNGTITVCTIGNASSTLASFDLGTAAGSVVNISNGTIIVQINNTSGTPRDYRHQAGLTGITTVTGGTLQLGNAASGAAKAFNIAGVVPNLVIDNSSAGHSATFGTPVAFNNISLNITINTGNTLSIGSNIFLFNGTSIINNGTLTANLAASRFITFRAGASATYQGSGVSTGVMTSFETQTDNFTFDSGVNPIVVRRIIIFVGNIMGANKLTLGDGSATLNNVQIGNTTTPTLAGTFDAAPTFNLGTGGQTISYLRTGGSRSTGFEVNPARTLVGLSYDDNDVTHFLTIAGGNLTNTGVLALTNGVILTGTNILTNNGTSTRTTGYVDGNLSRSYTATGAYTYNVGQNGFSPVLATVTALGTNPSSLTVQPIDAVLPGLASAQAASRHWRLTETGDLTADLAFTYLATDVNGAESDYRIYKREAGVDTNMCPSLPCVTVATHTVNISGVTNFSAWGAAENIVPTAATADISGRVLTADGRPIANVRVILSGGGLAEPINFYTGHFGIFNFTDLPVGQNYVLTVKSRRFIFPEPSRLVTLQDNILNEDFIAESQWNRGK